MYRANIKSVIKFRANVFQRKADTNPSASVVDRQTYGHTGSNSYRYIQKFIKRIVSASVVYRL